MCVRLENTFVRQCKDMPLLCNSDSQELPIDLTAWHEFLHVFLCACSLNVYTLSGISDGDLGGGTRVRVGILFT